MTRRGIQKLPKNTLDFFTLLSEVGVIPRCEVGVWVGGLAFASLGLDRFGA